ncbi:MAG: hypothetical protein PGN09_06705 [Sphingomonas fennica]
MYALLHSGNIPALIDLIKLDQIRLDEVKAPFTMSRNLLSGRLGQDGSDYSGARP